MEITELMIGDLLFYMDGDTLVPVVVRKINGEDNVVCLRQSDGHKFNTMIDFLRPIPLTPEIIEMNGFIHYDLTNFWMSELVYLDNYDEDGWRLRINCDNIPCECKYVHQLQNAFNLFKVNKKISLP